MVKLKIINRDNYIYNLKDEKENNYILNLEFFHIDESIELGDYLYISAELLNTRYAGYSTNYTFGGLNNKYGKDNIKLNDIDVIKIEKNGKEIYLKRIYG